MMPRNWVLTALALLIALGVYSVVSIHLLDKRVDRLESRSQVPSDCFGICIQNP